ncbi:hypothetical protein [Glutamicibacter sp. NPDC087344]|uniref:hypothetical protein n=1 Tax=Glutamicibacter sp. NPDC087344 TaxID=3363994 RepID=UPI00382B92F3
MKKTIITAGALLAALAVTGCTAVNQSAEPSPSPTAASNAPEIASSEPSATPSPASTHVPKDTGIEFDGASESLKALAVEKYAEWDEYNEKDSQRFRGAYKVGHVVMLPKVDPGKEGEWAKILEWSMPSENEVVGRIEGNQWSESELQIPGTTISCALINDDQKSFKTTFTTENGKISGSYGCENADDTEDSADIS